MTGVVVVFLLTFAWQAARFTYEIRDMGAAATRISMAVPYSSALFGAVLMLFYVVRNWLEDRRKEDADPDIPGEAELPPADGAGV